MTVYISHPVQYDGNTIMAGTVITVPKKTANEWIKAGWAYEVTEE